MPPHSSTQPCLSPATETPMHRYKDSHCVEEPGAILGFMTGATPVLGADDGMHFWSALP